MASEVSTNVSYQHIQEDVELFTGIRVAAKTQQRLVHRQCFDLPEVEQSVEELSVDGGKIRIRIPQANPVLGKNTRGCACTMPRLSEHFSKITLSCLSGSTINPLVYQLPDPGDGHDGVWNIISEIAPNGERREILDWYHLMENLHKVGGSLKRLRQAETHLWQGKVDAAIALFADCTAKLAQNFINYLDKHRDRIVNYQYYQSEQICSIGSGAVESAVKQID